VACVCAPRSGDLVWKFTTGNVVWSSPAIDAVGNVYVGSYDFNVYCIDGNTGTQKWVYATGGAVQSSPAIGPNGALYIGSSDGNVYALQDNN
jgi:outer membrane protein assembly factor BamB